MKLLTIDTSTQTSSFALSDGENIISEFVMTPGKAMTSTIIDCIDFVLRNAGLSVNNLDGFGIAVGPGSFTGLRVGIATVKGLAMATGKPVAGFSSLAMLAMNIPWGLHPICPMFDARKKEVYAGLYDCKGLPNSILPDSVASPTSFLDRITGPAIFVGEGAIKYRELISGRLGDRAFFAPPSADLPRASAGAVLAASALVKGDFILVEQLIPAYIRSSEAELALKERATHNSL